jgi:hypothetical protein
MKSLPATAWGDALLISREEARRIGYELEQAAERIEELEARATPALPQAEHDLEDVRCQCCGYMTYHSEHMGCIRSAYKQALPQVPEGMAIVPVERLTAEWADRNVSIPPEVKGRVMAEMFWLVKLKDKPITYWPVQELL